MLEDFELDPFHKCMHHRFIIPQLITSQFLKLIYNCLPNFGTFLAYDLSEGNLNTNQIWRRMSYEVQGCSILRFANWGSENAN
jgi:hypothetical protein